MVFELPIELFSEICKYLTYEEQRKLASFIPESLPNKAVLLAEIEYLRQRRLKQVTLNASKISNDAYKQFLAYHRMRLSRCLNANMLDGVRDRGHLRELFGTSSEMFVGLKQLVEETIVEWALKTQRIHEASATLFLYEKKEDQISDIKLASKFNAHFFKTFTFNLVISYNLEPEDDCKAAPSKLPVAMKYMLPGNLRMRTYGCRWKPPRSERKMKGLFSIKGHCRCCNNLSDLQFTGRV